MKILDSLTPAAQPATQETCDDWTSASFGAALARRLLHPDVRLTDYAERLAELTQQVDKVAADKATAAELFTHYMYLDALAQRFALAAVEALEGGRASAASNAAALASSAVRAQRAALAVLSALKAVREGQPSAPDNAHARAITNE